MATEQSSSDAELLHFGHFDGQFLGITLTVTSETLKAFGLTADDKVSTFEETAPSTVHSHELRHFHDFLLSPRGSITLRQRMAEALNVLSLQAHAKNLSASGVMNALPVPLGRWADLGEAQRRAFLEPLAVLVGELRVPPVPHLPVASRLQLRPVAPESDSDAAWFSSNVAAALLARARLHHALHDDEGWALTSQQVREGGAFCVQLQEAWWAHGEQAANALFQRTSTDAPSYVLPQDLWTAATGDRTLAALTAALTWSQWGAYAGGASTTPVARFARLLQAASESDHFHGPSWTEAFDEATGLGNTFDVLERQLREDEGFLEQLRSRTAGDEQIPTDFADLFSEFVAAKARLVDFVTTDQTQYLEPLKYLEAVERLPTPPLRLQSAPGHAIDLTHLGESAWDIVHRGGRTTDGRIGATELIIPVGSDVNAQSAGVVSTFFETADVLLDEELRDLDPVALELLRQRLPEVRLLNVLAS